MITTQLVSYIRAQLTAGVPRETVRQRLINTGWSLQDIAEAFSVVSKKAQLENDSLMEMSRQSFAGRKILFSLSFIFITVIYALWQNLASQQTAVAQTSGVEVTPMPTETFPTGQSPTPTPTPVPTPISTPTIAPKKPAGMYADGSYTGNAADAYYGLIQVKAIIRNGKITDVQFLQYPNDRDTSRYINGQAMPLLTQEAIQSQNANVDGVSGATDTSQAFEQSLASALALAKN